MRAFRLHPDGSAFLTDTDLPTARGVDVVVRVEAVGLCHSDIHLIDTAAQRGYPRPFTLGHEVAGSVVARGDDVSSVNVGDRVLVYAPLGCGDCATCERGAANYCPVVRASDPLAVGIGSDGGMAEFVRVPHFRHVVPIGSLSSKYAAPLADAALTPFHAVARYPQLQASGTVALVIGVGGLGHLAVQILAASTAAHVIAVDLKAHALTLAMERGADDVMLFSSDVESELRRKLGTRRCDVVFDFVGSDETMAIGLGVLTPGGALAVVGSAGGRMIVGKGGDLPKGAEVRFPFWGTLTELKDVVALAQDARIRVDVETMPLDQIGAAIERLREGSVDGRLVLIP